MSTTFCKIDDKHVPLYRVMWIADVPHFCGNDECEYEGRYEIRLEQGESVFGSREERDAMMAALDHWHSGDDVEEDDWQE
jgi:hypothetical protein